MNVSKMSDHNADIMFGQPTPPAVIVSDFEADMARLHQIEADIQAALDQSIAAIESAVEAARFLELWHLNHRYGDGTGEGLPEAPSEDDAKAAWEEQ